LMGVGMIVIDDCEVYSDANENEYKKTRSFR
jgi:hypothetical protein